MGIQLVNAFVIKYPHLSDKAFRVAVRMGISALDGASSSGKPPHLYYAGWEVLALALGRALPPDDRNDPAATHERRLAAEQVRRAIRELVDAGLVEPVGNAWRGSRQTYRLHFLTTREDSPP